MEFNQNRLRFVHCEHLFNNVNEIKQYVRGVQDKRASLYAEPMIFKYGNAKEPCIVLAIGSVGEGKFEFDPEDGTALNETYYIDFSQAERDINELYKKVGENKAEIERIDAVVKNILVSSGFNEDGEYVPNYEDLILKNAKSLNDADRLLSEYIIALEKRQELYVEETKTIIPNLIKSDTGTTLSSDVKLGTKIFNGKIIENIILEQEDGIFTNVDLDYIEDESKLVLTINGDKRKDVVIPTEYHIVSGKYDTHTECVVLKLNKEMNINGKMTDVININMADLIDEWTVMGEASETPIVLTKEHISSNELVHEGHHEWQDVLRADVRIVDKRTMPDNILEKTSDGKKLFVEGSAKNISYMDKNVRKNVQEAVDNKISKDDYSNNEENIITYRKDGLYSFIDFDYDNKSNKIIFKRTNPKGEIVTVEKELNSLQLIKKAYYDNVTEEIVIVYTDAKGDLQELRVPMQIVVDAFDVDNTDTTVTLTLNDIIPGTNTLKADVNISKQAKNILEDVGHSLYVRGTADNIEMIDKTLGKTVEESFTKLNSKLEVRIDEEKDRAEKEELQLNKLIENEKARAEKAEMELENSINAESERAKKVEGILDSKISNNSINLKNEIDRAISAERIIAGDLKDETDRAIAADDKLNDAITDEVKRATKKESELETSITIERNRAVEAETDLSERLTKVEKDSTDNSGNIDDIITDLEDVKSRYAMSVKDTTTVDLTKETIEAGGFMVSADVRLSTTSGNTIIKNEDGLFTNVDLTYNETNNTLHFRRNDEVADIVLNTVSTIDSITYDSLKGEIVIKYEGKNGDLMETRFPASELFKPIETDNNGNNVKLELKQVDGKDVLSGNLFFKENINNDKKSVLLTVSEDNKLSGEVLISELPDNALTVDNQLNLYVSSNNFKGKAENIAMCEPEKYGPNVCAAIGKVDDKINELENKFENYYDEDLINSMNKDIINLKSKTNIDAKDTASIDLTFHSTENSSALRADVIMSNDPHNLIKVYDDGFPHTPDEFGKYPKDTYNGLKFDGNIDYQLFTNEDGSLKTDKVVSNDKYSDWTRHIQEKRNRGNFNTRQEALEFLHNQDFLSDKKDGEPLLARYKKEDIDAFLLGYVKVFGEGNKTIQTLDNLGTSIDKFEYVPNAKSITATDEFGIQTVTEVPAESLYFEYTDASSKKHVLVVPLKELIEEYSYPESVSTFDGQLGKSDGESVKEHHNVKFDVERHEDNKSIIKADIDYYDCGEYSGEDFIK